MRRDLIERVQFLESEELDRVICYIITNKNTEFRPLVEEIIDKSSLNNSHKIKLEEIYLEKIVEGIELKIVGLDEFGKQLETLEKNTKKLQGTHNIEFSILFNEKFMHKNTNFDNIYEFFENAGLKIKSQEDFEELEEIELDRAVIEFTNFDSWQDMLDKAVLEYMDSMLFKGVRL